ncbi:protoporphyrinogen oxidase HemJ [Elioraea sp.]|uniref:protoporphyrinogen oxidase HemJ n=1 Tax=Elioraea sp. TaxID=2185103 RepID=UPI0025BD6D2E|nr:protoporphyrinogen oxidase HemJ [Elioraea sp.]
MTIDALAYIYPWVKSLHVIAIIAWMAALLYLPRLFVYHCEVAPGSVESERFKVMEYRLSRYIASPSSIAAWVFGILLVLTPGVVDWASGWWHFKMLGILVMTGAHHAMMARRRDFLQDRNRRPQRYFRIMNEVPTAAMVVIVVMVIARPF